MDFTLFSDPERLDKHIHIPKIIVCAWGEPIKFYVWELFHMPQTMYLLNRLKEWVSKIGWRSGWVKNVIKWRL